MASSFRPLAALLTESVAPELLYMEAKWSSLVSYGMSLDALQDFLPLDLTLDVKTVRYDTLKVAKRLEAELGEEQASFIEGEARDWELLPLPEGSFTVNWLRVLGTAKCSQVDQRVGHQLHAIVPLLDAFKSEQQPLELVFPRQRPLDPHA